MTLAVYAPGVTVEVRDRPITVPIPPPPLPVVTGLTDPAITDAPGGLTFQFVYGIAEKNAPQAIASLLDWIGQDDTPVASTKVGTGYVGKIAFDLTAICRKDSRVQVGLKGAGLTSVVVSGSGPLPPPDPPRAPAVLAVVYDDGSKENLSLDAEVETNTTTAYLLVKQPALPISSTSGPWLRFSAPKRAVSSAILTVTTMPKVYVGGTINVVKFTAGYLPQPATLAPWGGTKIMDTECWEDGPAYITERIIQTAYDPFAQRSFVNDGNGNRALQLMFDPRQSNLLDLKVGIWPEATEAWFSYDLMVMPGANLAVVENGKLPGFSTATRPDDEAVIAHYKLPFPHGTVGTLLAGNGGGMVNGRNGWSDRGDWIAPRKQPHPLAGLWPMSTYCYNPDFVDYNGQQIPWSAYGNGVLQEGRYYHLEHRVRVNSVPASGKGNNDGELESRIDGKLALFYPNLRLRDAGPYDLVTSWGVQTDLLIRSFWLPFYHGGHGQPLARVPAFRVRNFKVYRIS